MPELIDMVRASVWNHPQGLGDEPEKPQAKHKQPKPPKQAAQVDEESKEVSDEQ